MPKTYKHLNIYEREKIALFKSQGKTFREIAKIIKRNPSTLSRELKRNVPPINTGYYSGLQAHKRAVLRNQTSRCHPRLRNTKIRRFVENGLRKGWSPELISGRLKTRSCHLSISHEAIYQWIYADARHFIPHLVRAYRKRRHRGYCPRKHKKDHIPSRVSIKKRPQHVLKRKQIGHWETDTMFNRKTRPAIQVTVERKTRYSQVSKLRSREARHMSNALNRRLSRLPQHLRLSLTYDNGHENAEHLRTNNVTGTSSYFCEPYHSYERGTVENTIGLVRRFIPKKTDFTKVTINQLRKIEYWLNNRPRKILAFKTPAEVFKPAVALRG